MNSIKKQPYHFVQEIIKQYNIDIDKSINLDFIFDELGIKVVYTEIGNGVLGAAKVKGLKKLIVVAPSITNLGQKRFTLAHELGHIIMHQGQNYCTQEDLNVCITTLEKEFEANTFAAELLLPEPKMIEIEQRNELNMDIIKEISKLYETSFTATAIRLVNLSRNSTNLIYHKDGKVKWSTKSKDGKYIRYSDITLERIEQEKDINLRRVDTDIWINNSNEECSCFEQTIYFRNLNEYITILQFV